MSSLPSARFVVVGLGTSGRAAIDVLSTLGATVLGLDRSEAAVAGAHGVAGPKVRLQAVADDEALAEAALGADADVVVVSPGVPAGSPLLRRAAATGRPCWSEIELAWQLQQEIIDPGARPDWLTLTGTNGKTTTVGMLGSVLTTGGRRAATVGNVGTPAVQVVADGGHDVLAVELSSFQLHLTHSVVPLASACLNLAPDHLDWHGSFEAYRDAKARVYERTRLACIYSTADPATRTMVEQADVAEGARAIGTRVGPPAVGELGLVEDVLCDRAFGQERRTHAEPLAALADLEHLSAGGEVARHVVSNALSAAALARAAGVPAEAVGEGLRDYRSDAHRIEVVTVRDGVTWVDDSKATNPHAAAASLGALPPGRGVWIAGGLAKGARFDDLVRQVADRLRAVVLIGIDRQPLRDAVSRHAPDVPLTEVTPGDTDGVMDRAVTAAARLAQPGDTVLLAPACASMDQFTSYNERGEVFAAAVRGL